MKLTRRFVEGRSKIVALILKKHLDQQKYRKGLERKSTFYKIESGVSLMSWHPKNTTFNFTLIIPSFIKNDC